MVILIKAACLSSQFLLVLLNFSHRLIMVKWTIISLVHPNLEVLDLAILIYFH